jgi:hypothetical protein
MITASGIQCLASHHDCHGEGHATLPGRPEGCAHQLVNRVILDKINDYRLWHPVPGLPHHDGRGEGHATLPGRPEGRAQQLVNRVLLDKY